jgi:hypothetical protein
VAYALPKELGYAEVVNEPEAGGRGDPTPTSIVVYFLQKDAKTALTPAPTDVRFLINSGRNRIETLAMAAQPKAGDTSGGSRFASKPGPYALNLIRGELNATAGGSPVKIPVIGTR